MEIFKNFADRLFGPDKGDVGAVVSRNVIDIIMGTLLEQLGYVSESETRNPKQDKWEKVQNPGSPDFDLVYRFKEHKPHKGKSLTCVTLHVHYDSKGKTRIARVKEGFSDGTTEDIDIRDGQQLFPLLLGYGTQQLAPAVDHSATPTAPKAE